MELRLIGGKKDRGVFQGSDAVFACEFKEALVHQVVTAYQANQRSATRSQLTRAEVSHSTQKPWRQKGTGRARSGMKSSPIWRGGGRAFPNKPDENFTQKINRKSYKVAMKCMLSELVRESRLFVIEDIHLDDHKTKSFLQRMQKLELTGSVLIIVDELQENVYLASRNVPHVLVLEAPYMDPLSLVYFSNVVISEKALRMIEERLG